MEICKAPTRRLKALNEHNITHLLVRYTEMENVIRNLTKLTHNVHIIEGGIVVLSVVLELDKGDYPENLLFFFFFPP